MEKDKAVRDQRVFIRLDKVLELQRLYSQAIDAVILSRRTQTAYDHAGYTRLSTLEQVISLFELPIPFDRARIQREVAALAARAGTQV
jgi:hypothetical protein